MLKYTSLKEKDLEYLTFILRNGMVTAKQLMLKFQEPNIHRVYRRLRKLEDKKFIKHERIAHKVGVYLGTLDARNLSFLFHLNLSFDLELTHPPTHYDFHL